MSGAGASTARHAALYRILVRAYPPAFRRRYGDALVETFCDQLRAERARRPRGAATRVWAGIARDLFRSAPDQRWENLVARTTTLTVLLTLAVYATIAAVTRTAGFTMLLVAGLLVAGTRWVRSATGPTEAGARLWRVGLASLPGWGRAHTSQRVSGSR